MLVDLYNDNCEQYKGKVVGFTDTGLAEVITNYKNNGEITKCKCCETIIGQDSNKSDFCPICACLLGYVLEKVAIEYCEENWKYAFESLNEEPVYNARMNGIVKGFKNGDTYGRNKTIEFINGLNK